MSSVSHCKVCGSVLVLTLMLVATASALSLAGLERTAHQSQLAAALVRQAALRAETTRALAAGASAVGAARSFAGRCPLRCDWSDARRIPEKPGVTAVYVVRRVSSSRLLVTARATHADGGKAAGYALFDAGGAFLLGRWLPP